MTDLAACSGASIPTVMREVRRAEQAGIVKTRKDGNIRRARAITSHPLYGALSKIVLSAYGPPIVVAEEFGDLSDMDAVLLFGSWAARHRGHQGHTPNDVDVLVIGNPDRSEVDLAAERAEKRIMFPTQVVVRTRSQWESSDDPFVNSIKQRPLLVVLTGEDAYVLFDQLDDIAAGVL